MATSDFEKISGVKNYLARTKSVEELKAIADSVFTAATEEVTITGTSADGGSANGEITFPKWLYLKVLEELIGANDDTTGTVRGRQLCTFPDFGSTRLVL